jgi:hypothetical protein
MSTAFLQRPFNSSAAPRGPRLLRRALVICLLIGAFLAVVPNALPPCMKNFPPVPVGAAKYPTTSIATCAPPPRTCTLIWWLARLTFAAVDTVLNGIVAT